MYSRCPISRTVQIHSIVTFFNALFEKDHYFPGEAHDFWEIVFILSGEVGVTADKDVYLLESGNAVVHKPMEFHSIWSESGTRPEIIILSFYADNMPELQEGRIFRFQQETAEELKKQVALAKSVFTYEAGGEMEPVKIIPGKETEASFIACSLDCVIHKLLQKQNTGFRIHQSQSAKNYMFILSVLEENIYKKLTIPEIAKLCNMSESNLKKVFYKYAGRGIMNYFNTIKVKKAAELIENGMSVKEAASLLEFSDQNYFSTVFKRITGVSPAKYK